MKKTILLLALLLNILGHAQGKTIIITAEDVTFSKLTNSIKIVEDKIIDIPIYKDTLVETQEYKELVQMMNGYKRDYNQWLKEKKSNEEYNRDIATIINNLKSYLQSKENYEITKPWIDEVQRLIFKNKIYYHDNYGRTNNESIILSPNGKKPQKTRSFLDEPNYQTPIERCLWYCRTIDKLEEPVKYQNVTRYLEIENKLPTVQQYKNLRVPSNKTVSKNCLQLNDSSIVKEEEIIGTFNVSESKYTVVSESEGYAKNEVIETVLLDKNGNNLKIKESEILINSITGKKYFSNNPQLVSNIEDQKKLISDKQQSRQQLSKYGSIYYDKERESDMLKIQTGVMKLSGYNTNDIPEFISIYNSLYTKSANYVKQMPAHILILKKYYTLHKIQGRKMSQANINAWIKAVKTATPLRESMKKIVMNDHYGDLSFYPNAKYEGTQEDFDLYYNASLSILGI